mgnify:CR=1 FL=1
MAWRAGLIILLIFQGVFLRGQLVTEDYSFWEPADSLNRTRLNSVLITEGVLMAGTYAALGGLWYAEQGLGSFRTFDDSKNWLAVDKVGHSMTAYFVGDIGMSLLLWSGTSRKAAVWGGGTLGLVFLTGVELFDGHAREWGFSWSDMAANVLGTGLLVGQELLWQEQRITMKFSYHSTDYPQYNPALLGENAYQSLLKDYNGHTYWLSFNINSFTHWDAWPEWLNLAAGYGADGMISAAYDPAIYAGSGPRWQRQFYLAPDIDLRKIKVKSGFLRTALHLLNYLKFPMPTLEINEKGAARFYPLYF